MTRIRVVNKTRESVLGSRVLLASRWPGRLRGFLARRPPQAGEGILLTPCRAVHTLGLGFPLDIVFLDREGRVVACYDRLRPLRFSRYHVDAEHALEVPAGTIAATGTARGDCIVWTPARETAPSRGRAWADGTTLDRRGPDGMGVLP